MDDRLQEPHTIHLPQVHAGKALEPEDLAAIFQEWAGQINDILASNEPARISSAFRPDAWLRDMLTLSWDFQTLNGCESITTYLTDNFHRVHLRNVKPRLTGSFAPSRKACQLGSEWLECMLDFETDLGQGFGVVRLVSGDGDVQLQIYMLSLVLRSLKGHEEGIFANRPHGGNNSLEGGVGAGNWFERRQRQREFVDTEPAVLVIGAGHSGLMIGARLTQLGVPTLIVDRNPRIGDNWRNRYRTLVLHDPVHYCHMPYLPFPSNWPTFTPKDKIGDWLESYASIMELNVWMSTTPEIATYDIDSGSWTVTLDRTADGGSKRTVHPRHLILATGHSGKPLIPSLPGQEAFAGTIYHSSDHRDAAAASTTASGSVVKRQKTEEKQKKVVVVGTGNSGHDVAQNYAENGADVTMLQRGGTYVVTVNKGIKALHAGLYDETGPPIDEADCYGQSTPLPVSFALGVLATEKLKALDAEELQGLEQAGFRLDFGRDGSGLMRKYLSRGGGYYLDVGCSRLISEGIVKVRQSPEGIRGLEEDGLVLADGSKLEADVIVFATGYENMKATAASIIGQDAAAKLDDAWGLDDQGETKAMWRYSGHPNFWYMGGNFALCRWFSRLLALQIKAAEEGLYMAPPRGDAEPGSANGQTHQSKAGVVH